jgi:hypothetical protein
MIKKEIEGKELKQVLHFRFSFEPKFSEVDKSLFLAPPLRTTSVMYTIVDRYDNERETWSKSNWLVAVCSLQRRGKFLAKTVSCKLWNYCVQGRWSHGRGCPRSPNSAGITCCLFYKNHTSNVLRYSHELKLKLFSSNWVKFESEIPLTFMKFLSSLWKLSL